MSLQMPWKQAYEETVGRRPIADDAPDKNTLGLTPETPHLTFIDHKLSEYAEAHYRSIVRRSTGNRFYVNEANAEDFKYETAFRDSLKEYAAEHGPSGEAAAQTILNGRNMMNRKVGGPTLVERALTEPYKTKDGEVNYLGYAGAGIGLAASLKFLWNSPMNIFKKAALVVVATLSGGALSQLIPWAVQKFTGEEETPKTPELAFKAGEQPEIVQEQSTEKANYVNTTAPAEEAIPNPFEQANEQVQAQAKLAAAPILNSANTAAPANPQPTGRYSPNQGDNIYNPSSLNQTVRIDPRAPNGQFGLSSTYSTDRTGTTINPYNPNLAPIYPYQFGGVNSHMGTQNSLPINPYFRNDNTAVPSLGQVTSQTQAVVDATLADDQPTTQGTGNIVFLTSGSYGSAFIDPRNNANNTQLVSLSTPIVNRIPSNQERSHTSFAMNDSMYRSDNYLNNGIVPDMIGGYYTEQENSNVGMTYLGNIEGTKGFSNERLGGNSRRYAGLFGKGKNGQVMGYDESQAINWMQGGGAGPLGGGAPTHGLDNVPHPNHQQAPKNSWRLY